MSIYDIAIFVPNTMHGIGSRAHNSKTGNHNLMVLGTKMSKKLGGYPVNFCATVKHKEINDNIYLIHIFRYI